MPRLATPIVVLLLALTAAGDAAAQPPQPPSDREAEITIEVSTSDMVRRTAIFIAAGQAINRAADAGLDAAFGAHQERKTSDVLIRLGRLWFVNLPIAALSQGAAHDSGHFARYAEYEDYSAVRRMKQWPWPVPIAVSVEYLPPPTSFEEFSTESLPVLGGGEQASTLTKQRLDDRIYQHDTGGYFDWMLVAYASLDYPIYAWTDLSDHLGGVAGDFRQYTNVVTSMSPARVIRTGDHFSVAVFEAQSRNEARLRHDAWLNLADFSLWQAFARVGRYVATGERRARNATLAVKGIRFVPSAYATLSSAGPERGVDVRIVGTSLLTRVNVRRVSTPSLESRWGTGIAVRSRDSRRFLPEASLDLWQRAGRHPGGRFELGTMHALRFAGRPWEASARVGYKTEGYLLDAPQRATILASVALSARF